MFSIWGDTWLPSLFICATVCPAEFKLLTITGFHWVKWHRMGLRWKNLLIEHLRAHSKIWQHVCTGWSCSTLRKMNFVVVNCSISVKMSIWGDIWPFLIQAALCHKRGFNPFLNKPLFLRVCSTSLGNTAGKGEIARDEQFLLFPRCF